MEFVLSNDTILQIFKTEKMCKFIAHQQNCFLAHIIRREDNSLIKVLTFNDDRIQKRGRFTTLRKAVLQGEAIEPNKFYGKQY